jgi:hypothetical protein
VEQALSPAASRAPAYEIIPEGLRHPADRTTGAWWLAETLCYLTHLERAGRVERLDGEPEHWRAAA